MRFNAFLLMTLAWFGTNMTIKLQPVAFEKPASVTGVRLLNGANVQTLAGSQGNLMWVGGDQADSAAKALRVGGPGSTWDAHLGEDGNLAAVYTQPGSAVSWIMLRKTGEAKGTRLNADAFAVYVRPHFVKGPKLQVTSIRLADGKAQVMMLSPSSAPVGEEQGSITDARLLAGADGYWLFTLSRVPGVGGDAAPRETVSGKQMPGILHVTRLGEDLKLLGKPVPVFGLRPVYEFDVDAAPDHEVAVLATTPAGLIYARSALKETPVPEKLVTETPFEHPLSSPSLVVHDGKLICAVIENIGTPEARILKGQIE